MLNPSTLKFLKDVKKNNNREWFAENKVVYETAKADVVVLVQKVLDRVTLEIPGLKNIDSKKSVLRIYRDVRFSTNKDPYKTNFGVPLSERGKGVDEGSGFYLHIQPGASFIGGGYWMPSAPNLKMIRQEIDYNSDSLKSILNSKEFKKWYDGLSDEDSLKTAPKGYPKDHPEIHFLKLKSFTAFHALSDEDLLSKDVDKKIASAMIALNPFIGFLNNATHQNED